MTERKIYILIYTCICVYIFIKAGIPEISQKRFISIIGMPNICI